MPPIAENTALASQDHAIVVGISSYPRLGENFMPDDLDGPVNDARDVTNWLVNDAGLPCANVQCLISDGSGNCKVLDGNFQESFPPLSERPSRNDIQDVIEKFVDRARTAVGGPGKIGRRLWVYVAAHGFRSSQSLGDVCILPANAYNNPFPRNFCMTQWLDYLALNIPFDEVVLWLDCCSNIGYTVNPYGAPQTNRQRSKPARRFYLAATGLEQEAYETPDANGKIGGIFTRKLLAALRGNAPRSQGNMLSSKDLSDFLRNETITMQTTDIGENKPFKADVLVCDEFDLLKVNAVPTGLSRRLLTDAASGTKVKIIDSTLAVAGTYNVGDGGRFVVVLPMGFYKLEKPDGSSGFFEIKADQENDVEVG